MLVGDGGCISPFTFTNSNVNSLHSLFLLFKPRRNNYRSSIGRKNLEPKPCSLVASLGLVSFFQLRTSLDFLKTLVNRGKYLENIVCTYVRRTYNFFVRYLYLFIGFSKYIAINLNVKIKVHTTFNNLSFSLDFLNK